MKSLAFLVLLFATSTALAQQRPVDAASFSTLKANLVVRQGGWISLGKTSNGRAWYAHTKGRLDVVGIAVKIATCAIGNEYSTIETDTAFVNCSEAAQGRFPLHLHSLSIEYNDAQTGEQPEENAYAPMADSVPIVGGTAVAEAVRRSCLAVIKETAPH